MVAASARRPALRERLRTVVHPLAPVSGALRAAWPAMSAIQALAVRTLVGFGIGPIALGGPTGPRLKAAGAPARVCPPAAAA